MPQTLARVVPWNWLCFSHVFVDIVLVMFFVAFGTLLEYILALCICFVRTGLFFCSFLSPRGPQINCQTKYFFWQSEFFSLCCGGMIFVCITARESNPGVWISSRAPDHYATDARWCLLGRPVWDPPQVLTGGKAESFRMYQVRLWLKCVDQTTSTLMNGDEKK